MGPPGKDEAEQTAIRGMRAELQRDWQSLLVPILLSALVSSGVTAIGWVAKSAGTDAAVQTQLNEHDRRLKLVEEEEKNYVRVTDQAIRDGYMEEERKQINDSLRAMDAKLDVYIRENRRRN